MRPRSRGSASDALTNHLAFNYFPAKGLLALPMTVCDGGGRGVFGDKLSFSGLMVFDVSLTSAASWSAGACRSSRKRAPRR